MGHPIQCPKCGSRRLWNVRLLRSLVAVSFAILGAMNVLQFATAGQEWLDAVSGTGLCVGAVIFGLMASQSPPWQCRDCKGSV